MISIAIRFTQLLAVQIILISASRLSAQSPPANLFPASVSLSVTESVLTTGQMLSFVDSARYGEDYRLGLIQCRCRRVGLYSPGYKAFAVLKDGSDIADTVELGLDSMPDLPMGEKIGNGRPELPSNLIGTRTRKVSTKVNDPGIYQVTTKWCFNRREDSESFECNSNPVVIIVLPTSDYFSKLPQTPVPKSRFNTAESANTGRVLDTVIKEFFKTNPHSSTAPYSLIKIDPFSE